LKSTAQRQLVRCLPYLQDLRNRGATEVDLIVTDGHDGLLAAVTTLFTATPRQRCVVHKQRNVLNAIPHRERQEVSTELLGIWKQEKKEDARVNLEADIRQVPAALSRSDTEFNRR
jgi:transposase-like protein